jgi:prepilin-type N-terminal cleavage/methylation domain-containing protein
LGKKKSNKAFTIIEIVVVMAIIAIISTFGISAFINSRDQAYVSDTAEREAQNRSISITKGKDTNSRQAPNSTDTVIWGVRTVPSTKSFSLIYLDIIDESTTGASVYVQETPVSEGQVLITTSYINGNNNIESQDIGERYIFCSSPFAKTSTATESCTSGMVGNCFWRQSSNPARDWEMNTGNNFTSPNDKIKVVFSYKTHTQIIILNSKGDAYLE